MTPFASSQAIIITPINARIAGTATVLNVAALIASFTENKPTSVLSLFTMTPAFYKPINVMNKPIPTDTATFNWCGMASKIA